MFQKTRFTNFYTGFFFLLVTELLLQVIYVFPKP